MKPQVVNILGRDWIMTDIPAPDYANVKPSSLRWNFTYHRDEPTVQQIPRREVASKSTADR